MREVIIPGQRLLPGLAKMMRARVAECEALLDELLNDPLVPMDASRVWAVAEELRQVQAGINGAEHAAPLEKPPLWQPAERQTRPGEALAGGKPAIAP